MISATLRDIAIIIVAVETVIINALLIILVWQIWRLIRMLRDEIKPIIEDTKDTVGTVRGTADFVSNNVVDPVVKTSGRIAGFRQTLRTLQAEIRGQTPPPVSRTTPVGPPPTSANPTPPVDWRGLP
ncbi:MAG: DUF948 domain-containing protein [Caldilineaceae bacterium]